MSEKSQYAEMLEIPVTTTNIVTKPKKTRRKKTAPPEELKEQLINEVNAEMAEEPAAAEAALPEENEYSEVSIVKKEKKRRGVSVVAIQVAVIAVLAAVIVLSNFYIENTGINAFLRYVFSPSASEQTDDRTYNEFMAQLPTKNGDVVLEEGVMTFSAKGSVYSPCDGKVTAVTLKDGKYTIEVEHNKNLKSVISGADYAYVEIGSTVYASIPVGFTRGEEVSLCFYNGENAQITNFNVGDGEVVWAV